MNLLVICFSDIAAQIRQHTFRRPLLLRRSFASRLDDGNAVNPVCLFFVVRLKLWVQAHQVLQCRRARRVVGGDGRTYKALSQDFVARADTFGVEGMAVDATLDLREEDEVLVSSGKSGLEHA